MYADSVTNSMEKAITETERRRSIQMAYNEKHGIVPKTIKKEIRKVLEISSKETVEKTTGKKLSKAEKAELISKLKVEMKEAAKMLEFQENHLSHSILFMQTVREDTWKVSRHMQECF